MTTYNTGLPVPSADPRDRYDNSQTFDEVINGTLTYYVNRKGANVYSLAGMAALFNAAQVARANEYVADKSARDTEFAADQAERVIEFNEFLDSSGYETPVDYAPGISITRTTQQVRYLGELYRPKISAIPFTTTTFPADESKWLSNGDNSLRQELALNGAAMTGYAGKPLDATLNKVMKYAPVRARREPRINLIAHRGFAWAGPQSSMLAITQAWNLGADAIETDIGVSADGVFYLFHDNSVDALTNGTGNINALTSAYLDTLTFDSMAGTPMASVGLARLTEALDWALSTGAFMYMECKSMSTLARVDEFVDLVASYNMLGQSMLCTFFTDIYARLVTRNANANVGLLAATGSTLAQMQDLINLLAARPLQSSIGLAYQSIESFPSIVDYANQRQVEVYAYTIGQVSVARRVMKLGVNGLVSETFIGK